MEQHRQAFAKDGRQLDYIAKWSPRDSVKAVLDTWRAVAASYWEELRLGKRQAIWAQSASITVDKFEYVTKRVMRLVERTANREGQLLLEPTYELEGW